MRPRMRSDDKPPPVTTPRNTLSERRGSVRISRGEGITNSWVDIIKQNTFRLPRNRRDEQLRLHGLHNARSNGQEELNQ